MTPPLPPSISRSTRARGLGRVGPRFRARGRTGQGRASDYLLAVRPERQAVAAAHPDEALLVELCR